MGCTKPRMSSVDIEDLVHVRVKEFGDSIEEKLAGTSVRCEQLARRQGEQEAEVVTQREEARVMVDTLKRDLVKSIDDGFINNRKEFDKIFKQNDKKIESQITMLSQRLDDIELVIKLGRY